MDTGTLWTMGRCGVRKNDTLFMSIGLFELKYNKVYHIYYKTIDIILSFCYNISMKLLDKIRNLISGTKRKSLPIGSSFNKTDIDKTMPFITIGAITSLISDQEVFNRFMHFDQNKQYFEGLTPEFVAEAVKTYVEFMNDKGAKFDRKSLKRIKQIEDILPKEKRDSKEIFVQYSGIDKAVLYNTAISIISNPQEFNQYLECQRTRSSYNGIAFNVLSDYISSELFTFTRKIATNSEVENNIRFLMNKDRNVKDNTYRVDPRLQINPDFERAVLGSIQPTNDPAEFALQLYNELNKRVKYNPSFFALDQDLTDQFAYDIYYQPFNTVNLQNNSLICKQWAELYAYFLEKNGFEAYVCGSGKHKNVKAYYGTTLIEADATNQTTSPSDPSRLTDLTRSKLGVRPVGFKAYEFHRDKQSTRNLSTIQLNYDIGDFSRNQGANEKLLEIMDLIDEERDLTDVIMGLNNPDDRVGTIMKKIIFISDMLKGASLDNMDSVGYLNHLFRCTLNSEERQRAKKTNAFYKNLYTNDCDMVPIISINVGQDKTNQKQEDYIYFEFVQDTHEIKPISREKLIEKVVCGEYIQGRGKHDKISIPGIPEITDEQFINQARARKATEFNNQSLYNEQSRNRQDTIKPGNEENNYDNR